MLNRIKIGQEIPEDIKKLKERVRKENSPEIKKEVDAIYIYGTNKNVNKMNIKRLSEMKGEEHTIPAICLHKSIKKFKPHTDKGTGTVQKTPFLNELKIKIGAKVMLTYNVDTSDGLAKGDLIGIIKDEKGYASQLIIKFEVETHGQDKRRKSQQITNRFPGGTPIEKVNFPFSISKSKTSVINTANVIQFPIKLAFACTAHKIQGATIPKPRKMIIDVNDIWMAGICYVMLSRICALWQLYIINQIDETKMYPDQQALKEFHRLETISKNKNLSYWEEDKTYTFVISSLNCRSLKKHHTDIISDDLLMKSDVICLQETWLEENSSTDDLSIPTYDLHLNSDEKGKGIAIYSKRGTLIHKMDIKEENMQLSKFTSATIDIVLLYRSQNGDLNDLKHHLDALDTDDKPLLIIGDFNFCFLETSSNATKRYLKENQFLQLIKEPTHIEGNLLDQANIKDARRAYKYSAELHSKYYTDHKALSILVRKSSENH